MEATTSDPAPMSGRRGITGGIRLGLWGSLIVLLLLLGPAASAAPGTKAATFDHAGRYITDSQGRVVTLRGFNMVNKLAATGYAPDGVGFGADDARFLARNGFNVVRLGIIWKALEPQPGVYDDAYLRRIVRTYRVLRRQDIAVLLDFHQDMYNERFQGEGAPDWAVVGPAATEDPSPQAGFPYNYIAQDAVNHAFDAFWANTEVPGTGRGVQDFFAAAWAHVAEEFRGKPGIVGYNLLNEPWMGTPLQECALAGGGTAPDACGIPEFEATTLTDFHRRVTRAIREVDERTMVYQAPILTFDFGGETGVRRIDRRGGFGFNAYCGQLDPAVAALLPFLKDRPCSYTADLSFDHALAESRRTGDALFLTEFGATDDVSAYADYLDRANALSISWTHWAYCGCGDPTTSANSTGSADAQALVIDPAQPPRGSNVKADKLRTLAQPYARLVSGTPGKSAFDSDSRRFRFSYRTKQAGGDERFDAGSITEVVAPEVQYPKGYRAWAKGAEIVSEPGAPVLELAQRGGAKRVEVSLRPG